MYIEIILVYTILTATISRSSAMIQSWTTDGIRRTTNTLTLFCALICPNTPSLPQRKELRQERCQNTINEA